MPKPKPQRRSPITDPPARRAGESLEKRVYEGHFARWFALTGAASVLVGVAVALWIVPSRWLDPRWMVTVAAVFTCGWLAYEVRGNWDKVRRELLGAAGERAVGDVLDDIRRELGYYVLHDVPIRRDGNVVANVDHVLIGKAGVLAIETKTRMKPRERKAQVTFDGNRILVDGRVTDRDPLVQARANAKDLENLIREMTGNDLRVRPVILFPGWWVHPPKRQDFWLLNPKQIFRWLQTEEQIISASLVLRADVAEVIAQSLVGQDSIRVATYPRGHNPV